MKKKIAQPLSASPALVLTILIGTLLVLAVIALLIPRRSVPTTNPEYQRLKRELSTLKKQYQANPQDINAATSYAFALYATANNQAAIRVYNRVVELNKHDARALNNLGNLYRKEKHYQRAIAAYQSSIKADRRQINAYVNLASLYTYDLGKVAQGRQIFQRLLSQNPNNPSLKHYFATLVKITGTR